jgi:hypothetical protein
MGRKRKVGTSVRHQMGGFLLLYWYCEISSIISIKGFSRTLRMHVLSLWPGVEGDGNDHKLETSLNFS